MKLGDDADEIDLDVTLEKYDVTKAYCRGNCEQATAIGDACHDESARS
jgi:hypothetical protein